MVTESVKASKVCDEELTRLNQCLKEEQRKMNSILVSKSMLEEELEKMKAEVGRKEKLFRFFYYLFILLFQIFSTIQVRIEYRLFPSKHLL